MAFALQPGQSLDSRVPPGPFRAEFTVPFLPGSTRHAQIGAEFQGGKLIVLRRGQPILSDFAGDKPRVALSNQPANLLRDQDEITLIFESDGKLPCRVRAIWQPEEALVPLPLPAVPTPLLSDDALRGFALVQQFNCAACHASGDVDLQPVLAASPGPILGDAGARIQPEWIRQWLRDPQSMRRGALMPALSADADTVEDLTHFLASMGGPVDAVAQPDMNLADTGMVVYHSVGCFACHGPLTPIESLPGGRAPSHLQVLREYQSMGRPSQKFTAASLTEFLRDPVSHWPSGRMPSMTLEPLEAEALASYLLTHDQREGSVPKGDAFTIDAARAERGKASFAALGCINCHSLGPDRPAVPISLASRPLESLAGSGGAVGGCLSEQASKGVPRFSLDASQREAISVFLRSLPQRRTTSVPLDRLALTSARLNCTNCHVFNGDRGAEAAINEYFTAREEADLGDEGRVPPNLSDVGGKLNPQWFHQVLAERGIARPYLSARMPQFGANNVADLPQQFAAAAGLFAEPDHGPTLPADYADAGRRLAGARAMNCIQCHTVAGHASTGTPGPDLAHMAERLRYAAFSRWIHDPQLTRPGTRMPTFFVGGLSGFTDVLNGDAHQQVDALWAYLSLGEFMPLPEGLTEPASMALSVKNEPVILRSFIKGAGVRAIAVGYPERIHLAFDAAQCRLAEVWQGEFLNAAGAWANRGGTETNPAAVSWSAPKDALFVSAAPRGGGTSELTLRFRGYQLDDKRRPTFMYDATGNGDLVIHVHEQPRPSREGGKPRLMEQFTLEGPPGALVVLMPGKRTTRGVSGDAGGSAHVTLDDQGKTSFELEVTW
jgi:mono/diheme cytochrome c family protein